MRAITHQDETIGMALNSGGPCFRDQFSLMEGYQSVCGWPSCGKWGKLKCSLCLDAHYCGAECQKRHWRVHKLCCTGVVAAK